MPRHTYALDAIVPADPHDPVRAKWAELASEDRPGDPWSVPFDARDEPAGIVWPALVITLVLIGFCLIASVH